MSLSPITEAEFEARLKKVKLLLLDVDGILTDASIFFVEGTGFTRSYNIYDGYGIKLLLKAGIPVGIISAGQSKDLQERIKMLGIEHFVLASEDKLGSAKKIAEKLKISLENVAFMGDELFDVPALKAVGLSISVPGAPEEVKRQVSWITKKSGGHGAVREIVDAIRKAQNLTY